MNIEKKFPILEFDNDKNRIITPDKFYKRNPEMPKVCVLCFFSKALEKIVEEYNGEVVGKFKCENAEIPVYKIKVNNKYIAITKAGVGGPVAAGQIEDIHAQGCDKFLAIGSAGVLDKEIQKGKLMIPVTAIRDEGVSYHYVAPSREINMDVEIVKTIEEHLIEKEIPYLKVKTWTTDAFYRETSAKMTLRKKENCVSVEMECASYIAVSQYLKIKFGQILYAGDNLDCEEWDSRDFQTADEIRHQLILEAIEIIQKF